MPSSKHFAYYLARLQRTAPAARAVLDIGCGGGELVTFLRAEGYDAWGSEVEPEAFWPGQRTAHPHVTYAADPRVIPYASERFDAAIANQVIEHVDDLEALAREASRVLRPGGVLFATFPLRSAVIEQHCLSPLAHRFAPGPVRQAWLFLTCPKLARDDRMPELAAATGLRRRLLSSRSWDRYLATCCRYRTPAEIREITSRHFAEVATDRDAYGRHMLGHYLPGVPAGALPRVATELFCSLANDAWRFRKA